MNACPGVRERLPGLEAGEPDEAGDLAHLSACPACAAQARRLRAELDALRAAWSPLAPAPGLARRLLRRARRARAAGPAEPRLVPWPLALSALAAVLLGGVGLALWQGRGTTPEATSEGPRAGEPQAARATQVVAPPPAVQLEAARAANRPDLDTLGETLPYDSARGNPQRLQEAVQWTPEGGPRPLPPRLTTTFEPPLVSGGAVQRWVYADPEASTGPREWTTGRLPERGEVLLGAPLAAMLALPTESLGALLEVTLASPDGSVEATVVARMVPSLGAPAVVPEALARALCLQQFEIPGGARLDLGSKALSGQRCRVRVTRGPLGRLVEAVALGPAPADLADRARGAVELRLEGVLPRSSTSSVAASLPYAEAPAGAPAPPGAPGEAPAQPPFALTRTYADGWDGTQSLPGAHGCVVRLSWHRRPGAADGASPASAVEAALDGAALHLGGLDPGLHTVEIQTLRLPGPFPAGARGTLALVWRGPDAVPSLEGVSQATVAADGSLTFPRRAGERAAALRLRVVTADGEASWHRVPVGMPTFPSPEGAFVRVALGADGSARLDHVDPASGREWHDEGLWSLVGAQGVEQLAALQGVVATLTGAGAPTDPAGDGGASFVLLLDGDAAAADAAALLVAAAAGAARLSVADERGGSMVTWAPGLARAWEEAGLRGEAGGLRRRVILRSSAGGPGGARTLLREEDELRVWGDSNAPAPAPLGLPAILPPAGEGAGGEQAARRAFLEAWSGAPPTSQVLVEVVVERCPGSSVPARDLLRVLHAFAQAGVTVLRVVERGC